MDLVLLFKQHKVEWQNKEFAKQNNNLEEEINNIIQDNNAKTLKFHFHYNGKMLDAPDNLKEITIMMNMRDSWNSTWKLSKNL